jgi:hypothetical protein
LNFSVGVELKIALVLVETEELLGRRLNSEVEAGVEAGTGAGAGAFVECVRYSHTWLTSGDGSMYESNFMMEC